MTYANFKLAVCGFMNRSAADLTQQAQDMVLVAANMAKANAQKRKKFKMARTTCFIAASGAGTDISTARTTPVSSGGTLVAVQGIESGWLYATQGGQYYKARSVEKITSQDLRNYFPSGNAGELNPNVSYLDANSLKYYLQGTKLYVLGLSNTAGVYLMLDVWANVPDYSGVTPAQDIFLDYHSDWLIPATCDILNIFIKEDQRVLIAQGKLEAAFTAMCSFDDTFAEGDDDLTRLE